MVNASSVKALQTSVKVFRANPLRFERGSRRVLDGVSLDLEPGVLVSVLGANGAGKSTLMRILANELAAESLEPGAPAVTLDGEALQALGALRQARKRAVLPQTPSLGFDLAVREVVEMGGYPFSHLETGVLESLYWRALAYANAVALADRRYAGLSGGEQQRVQFARVVFQVLAARASDPITGLYLLLDEPSASLDPSAGRALLAATRQLAQDIGVGVLLVLHDVNLAALWSDRIVLLHDGGVLAVGAPYDVLTPAAIKCVYDAEVQVIPHPVHTGTPLVVFSR